jgi:tetratricopeptide (TPR) repeat protein
LQIDPGVPEGHYIRARLAWTPQGGFQHEYAIREIGVALAERPNLTEGFDWLATILFHVGLVEDGRTQWARALAINPNDALARSHSILLEILTGNYEKALEAAKTAAEGMETSWALYMTGMAYIHVRDLAAADKILDEAARKFPVNVLFHSARAISAALRNDPDAAARAIERTFENRKPYGHFHHAEYDIACALAVMGRQDEAFDRLQSVVDNGFPCLAAIENNQFLTSLRPNPRYRSLADDLRRRREHYAQVYESVRNDISSS